MRRALTAFAALVLIAATPNEVIPDLEDNGYYIEPGAAVSENVVSNAVSDGRNAGGRLYMVVLAEEPPGGATTFSDSTLDLLPAESFVVTVAPETVGFAENGDLWTTEQMNDAVDASLDGSSDDEVVRLFIDTLTGETQPGGGAGSDEPDGSGGFPWGWILLLGGGGFLAWWYFSNRSQSRRAAAGRMAEVKTLAKEKLDEVANDILEMEDEVSTSGHAEVKQHYQNATALYSRAMQDTDTADTLPEMMTVSEQLDLAIWELDCAEALLDGKEKPPKPEPPKPEPVIPPPPPEAATPGVGTVSPRPSDFDRRPQRQSGGTEDMMTMLLTMMAMGGMRGRGGGFGGGFGGWTGGSGGSPRPPMGGGGRSRGGGRRRG